ncbi:unnamed protein product [Lampetra planeri]
MSAEDEKAAVQDDKPPRRDGATTPRLDRRARRVEVTPPSGSSRTPSSPFRLVSFALRRQRDRKRDSRPLPNAVSRRSAHARAACVSLTGDAFVAARGTNREDFSGGGGS